MVKTRRRRVGLLPPIQRPLEYVTATKSFSPATDMPQLQPVMSKARSSQQANKQPSQGGKSQSSAGAVSRNPAAAAALRTARAGCVRAAEAQLASTAVEPPKDQPNSDQQICLAPQIDFNLLNSRSDGLHDMTAPQLDKTSHKSIKSPKRGLGVHATAIRQSARNKALRLDN
ncbi:MAG: hypothetical protein FRX49_09573 [Trebouxia sp. A1-2]|nr:MAG: hypothetical protein FRX49_09573 [Trebouxia sp. A1-2]